MAVPVLESQAYGANLVASTSLVIDKPAGTAVGDLLVALVGKDQNAGSSWTMPAGWEEAEDLWTDNADVVHAVGWRIADGTEGANFTFTGPNITGNGWILRISGADEFWPLTQIATTEGVTVPAMTTVIADMLILGVAFADGSDTHPVALGGTGWAASDQQSAPVAAGATGIGSAYGEKDVASPGSTENMTVTLTVADGFNASQIAVSPPWYDDAYAGLISYVGRAIDHAAASFSMTPDLSALGLAIGDFMIASCWVADDVPTFSAPTGWTQRGTLGSTTGDDRRMAVFWKIVESGEDTTPTFTYSGVTNFPSSVMIEVFRGVDPANPINSASDTNPVFVNTDGTNSSQRTWPTAITNDTKGAWHYMVRAGYTAAGNTLTGPPGYTARAAFIDDTTYTDRGQASFTREIPGLNRIRPKRWAGTWPGESSTNGQAAIMWQGLLNPIPPVEVEGDFTFEELTLAAEIGDRGDIEVDASFEPLQLDALIESASGSIIIGASFEELGLGAQIVEVVPPPPDTALGSEIWAEVWTRPGHPDFGRVQPWVPSSSMFWHDGLNLIGDGRMTVLSDWAGLDDTIRGEPDDPELSRRSLIRFFSAFDPTRPLDWLPQTAVPDGDKLNAYTNIDGIGIKALLGHARVEAWDWFQDENIWQPRFPDWVYGGKNILGNPEFDSEATNPRKYLLAITATGGTFKLGADFDETDPIIANPSDNRIETWIERDLTSFDDVLVAPASGESTGYLLVITGDGGTFTIKDDVDETLPIAWDASFATIKTRIETDLGSVTTVDVAAGDDPDPLDETRYVEIDMVSPIIGNLQLGDDSITNAGPGEGNISLQTAKTSDKVFDITYVEPPFDVDLFIADNSLTGGSVQLSLVEEGGWDPSPWTKSQQISFGTPREFGIYDEFEVRDWDGYRTIYIDPGFVTEEIDRYAGLQQIVDTETGGLYQTGIWVWPTAPGQQYRLVLREIDEDLLLDNNGDLAWKNNSAPMGQWTLVEIPNVIASSGQTIFRFANINPPAGDPAPFYVRSAFMNEGMPAATLGQIGWELYDDATINHDGRQVWLIEGTDPAEFYLVPTFTPELDSNGVPWDKELSVTLVMRKSYSQVMADMVSDFGYEYKVSPIDVENGIWGWDAYNPGTMMTDFTSAFGPAIQGGSRDIKRRYERRAPGATHFMVEGEERLTARAENAGLVTALGRIETSELNRDLATPLMLQTQAQEQASLAAEQLDLLTFTFVDPIDVPLFGYGLGDLLNIVDPPEVPVVPRRFVDIALSITPELVEWECQYGAAAASPPESAVADAVYGLLTKFEYPDLEGQALGLTGLGGGLAPTRVVAVAGGYSTERADLVGDGQFDEEEINYLLSSMNGRLLMGDGHYAVRPDAIHVVNNTIEGMGRQTVIHWGNSSEASVALIRLGVNSCLRHVQIGVVGCVG